MTKGTEIVNQIVAALEGIRTENGYRTDAGQMVVRGTPESLAELGSSLPAIAISTACNGIEFGNQNTARNERNVCIAGIVSAGHVDYESDLDELADDIVKALRPFVADGSVLGTLRANLSGGTYTHPANADGNQLDASVVYFFSFSHEL